MSNFFTPAMSKLMIPRAPLRVTMPARAPTSDSETEATYSNFPLNIATAGDIGVSIASTWSGTLQHRIWANRCNIGGHVTKPNTTQPNIAISGTDCGLWYTTITKANAATLCRLSYSAGYLQNESDGVSGWGDIATAAGLSTSTWSNASTNASTIFTVLQSGFWTATDLVVLPKVRLCDAHTGGKEFSIDYEPHDSRSTTDTTSLATSFASLAHGKGYKCVFYTNPLDGTVNTGYNGLIPVVDSVLAVFDYFDLLVYSQNTSGPPATSLVYQMGLFTNPDKTKFQVTYSLSDLTVTDASDIATIVRQNGLAGIELWPNGAIMGGDCSTNSSIINQISTLVGIAGC